MRKPYHVNPPLPLPNHPLHRGPGVAFWMYVVLMVSDELLAGIVGQAAPLQARNHAICGLAWTNGARKTRAGSACGDGGESVFHRPAEPAL